MRKEKSFPTRYCEVYFKHKNILSFFIFFQKYFKTIFYFACRYISFSLILFNITILNREEVLKYHGFYFFWKLSKLADLQGRKLISTVFWSNRRYRPPFNNYPKYTYPGSPNHQRRWTRWWGHVGQWNLVELFSADDIVGNYYLLIYQCYRDAVSILNHIWGVRNWLHTIKNLFLHKLYQWTTKG